MTQLTEYTGILTIKLKVTIAAKSRKKALELLSEIYPDITLSYGENVPDLPDLIEWCDDTDDADWEIEDDADWEIED
jgi:hypothetical protein